MFIPFVVGGSVGARCQARLASAISLADDSAQVGRWIYVSRRIYASFPLTLFILYVTTDFTAKKQHGVFFFIYSF